MKHSEENYLRKRNTSELVGILRFTVFTQEVYKPQETIMMILHILIERNAGQDPQLCNSVSRLLAEYLKMQMQSLQET